MKERMVSIADGKQNFNKILKEAEKNPILIFNEKEKRVAGAIISSKDFREYNLLKSYFKAIKLSEELSTLEITASKLSSITRKELEGR